MHLLQLNPEGALILNATCVMENAIDHILCESPKAFRCILFWHNIPSNYLLTKPLLGFVVYR